MTKATWILTLAAATLSGVPALAQEATPKAKPEAKPEATKPDAKKADAPRRGRRGQRSRSPVRYLKAQLKLTDAQAEKMEAFYAERGKSRREMWKKMRSEGKGFDYQGAMAKSRASEDAKLKLILTAEQMKTYLGIRKKQDDRSQQWRNRGRRNGRTGGRRGGGLKERALAALKLDKETQEALAPIVEKVAKKLGSSREAWGKFRSSTRDVTDEETLKTLIATYRKDRDAARAELKAARAELTEFLTPTQEAAMIRLGLLD